MLKFSKLDGPISCVSEGGQLWTAWSTLAIRWASDQLNKGTLDSDMEDIANVLRNEEGDPIISTLFSLTADVLFRCNYGATLEGLIANKMIVDTVMQAPDYVPYWLKCIFFFIIVIPMGFVTGLDDIIGSQIIY